MAAVDGQPAAVLEVSLDPVHDRNVNQLRTLNRCIFPVRYQDKVYADAMTAGEFSSLGESHRARGPARGPLRAPPRLPLTACPRSCVTARLCAAASLSALHGYRGRRDRVPLREGQRRRALVHHDARRAACVPRPRRRLANGAQCNQARRAGSQLPRRVPARTGASAAARSWRVERRAHAARVCLGAVRVPAGRACPCTLLTATCVCALLFCLRGLTRVRSVCTCARARRAQTSNDEAVSFYQKLGFEVRETVKGYYKRLDPPDAYLIARPITHTPKPEDCRA